MSAVMKLDELLAPITTMKAAEAIAGPLGEPSKMPGYAYGLSAEKCITGSKLQKIHGSTCHKCYALKGHYVHKSVKMAHARRLAGIEHPRWVEAMVFMIRKRNAKWFRWHDSGDLQSLPHLMRIVQIAQRCASTRFWLPTREHAIVARYISMGGVVPKNLTIRMSATLVDAEPNDSFGLPTSTVVREAPLLGKRATCRAHDRDNKCGNCRMCWDPEVKNVSYPLH